MSADLVYGHPLRIEEVKAAGEAWEVSGYASTFGNVDLGGDVVLKGAFAETLTSGAPVRFLFSHDPSQVLGTVLDLREDASGLKGRFRISKTRLGEDVHTLLKDQGLDSFSIGYIPRDYEFDDAGVRKLKAVDLLEVSVVAMPMNPQATVTAVKAADLLSDLRLDGIPISEALEKASLNGDETLRLVSALWERRRKEGQRPSDRLVALVEDYRQKRLKEADDLLALLVDARPAAAPAPSAPPPSEPDEPAAKAAEAPAPAAGRVDAYLRLARLRELRQKFGLPPLTPGGDGAAA